MRRVIREINDVRLWSVNVTGEPYYEIKDTRLMKQIQLGDIVLRNQADGTQTPSIIVRLDSQESAVLYDFGIGGSGGSSEPIARGTEPGQWQPRYEEEE